MHVSQADIFRRQFGLLPFSGQPGPSSPVALPGGAPRGGREPSCSPLPPLTGVGVGGRGSSWDPAVFQPDGDRTKAVSRYCGLQLSEVDLPPVSQKPGTGFAKEGCGKWVRTLKSGGYTKKIVHNCDVLSCPVCMPGAITQKANDIEERFSYYEQAKIAENAVLIPGEQRKIKPRHFVFTISPRHMTELIHKIVRPTGVWDPEAFLDLLRDEFKTAIKVSGLIGGFSVYHDARVRHPDTGLTGSKAKHLIRREAMVFGNMKDDDPDWKLYDHVRKQKNHERYYYFAPHFHVIAFGKIADAATFEKDMPGWKYHNKKDVKTIGGLARYLISHQAMLPNRHACTWFGRLSSAVLGKNELKTIERPVICKETGEAWIVTSSVFLTEIGKEYTETVTEYEGFFRKKKRKHPGEPAEPKPLKLPGTKRPMAPPWVKERGIRAMAQYCDEWGKL